MICHVYPDSGDNGPLGPKGNSGKPIKLHLDYYLVCLNYYSNI